MVNRTFWQERVEAAWRRHPAGRNVVVAHDVDRPFQRTFGEVAVRFVGPPGLVGMLVSGT